MLGRNVAWLLASLLTADVVLMTAGLVARQSGRKESTTPMLKELAKVADYQERLPLVFMGVYTSPSEDARFRRQEIRETYWQHPLLRPGGPVVAKFIVGWTNRTDEHALALRNDTAEHPNDFLSLDVQEAYSNLTMKTMALLRWFASNSPAKFLLKMDDDTFPHVQRVVTYLEKEKQLYLHLGMLFPCAPVLRFTKWAENPQVWNHSFFPKYMQGSGYFLSAPLVHQIAGPEHYSRNAARMLNNEDAAVGVWIEHLRWEDPDMDIAQRNVPSTLTGCQPGDLLSMNNQRGYMSCYWRRHLRGEDDVCCYGPLDNLRQSLLQVRARVRSKASARLAAAHKAMLQTRCYGDW